VCGLVDYELFEYRGLRGVLIVDLCFEYGVFTCVLNFRFYLNL